MLDAKTSPPDGPAPGDERTARQLLMLEELAEIGMKLVRVLGDQARAAAAEAPTSPRAGELRLALTQVSRSVRQTLALETRLKHQAWTMRRRDRADHQLEDAQAFRRHRKLQVSEIVRPAIETGVSRHRLPQVLGHLYERLADPSEDITGQPLGAVVARICRRIGLTPDLSLWTDEHWVLEDGPGRGAPRASPPLEGEERRLAASEAHAVGNDLSIAATNDREAEEGAEAHSPMRPGVHPPADLGSDPGARPEAARSPP